MDGVDCITHVYYYEKMKRYVETCSSMDIICTSLYTCIYINECTGSDEDEGKILNELATEAAKMYKG